MRRCCVNNRIPRRAKSKQARTRRQVIEPRYLSIGYTLLTVYYIYLICLPAIVCYLDATARPIRMQASADLARHCSSIPPDPAGCFHATRTAITMSLCSTRREAAKRNPHPTLVGREEQTGEATYLSYTCQVASITGPKSFHETWWRPPCHASQSSRARIMTWKE